MCCWPHRSAGCGHDHGVDVTPLFNLRPRHVSVVIGAEQELHAASFILARQLIIAEVVADQRTAADAPDGEDTEMVACRVVLQVPTAPAPIASAEQLVIAVDDAALVVDD